MNLATRGFSEGNPSSMESPRVNSPTQEQMGPCGPRRPGTVPWGGQGSEQAVLASSFPQLQPQGRKACSYHPSVSSGFLQRAPINCMALADSPSSPVNVQSCHPERWSWPSPGNPGPLAKGLDDWMWDSTKNLHIYNIFFLRYLNM